MTERNDGGQAFPEIDTANGGSYGGMSLRDWFAGQALAGILASFPEDASFGTEAAKEALALDSYDLADAMLKARDQ